MWIKTEDNENGGMEMSHWPRAIEIVNDERTGAKRYQFTYTAPTAYQDRTIIKRNPSNGSSFALSTPVGPANVRQADSRLARVVKKQHRQPGAHFAARPSNPNVPFRKQPRHCVRSPGMGSDHWCPFSGPRYVLQFLNMRFTLIQISVEANMVLSTTVLDVVDPKLASYSARFISRINSRPYSSQRECHILNRCPT